MTMYKHRYKPPLATEGSENAADLMAGLQLPDDPFRRESTELRDSQWLALDELAELLGCVSERGPKAGQPSWRALLYRMAEVLAPPPAPLPPEPPPPSPLDTAICELFGLEPTHLWNKEMIRAAKTRRDGNAKS